MAAGKGAVLLALVGRYEGGGEGFRTSKIGDLRRSCSPHMVFKQFVDHKTWADGQCGQEVDEHHGIYEALFCDELQKQQRKRRNSEEGGGEDGGLVDETGEDGLFEIEAVVIEKFTYSDVDLGKKEKNQTSKSEQ